MSLLSVNNHLRNEKNKFTKGVKMLSEPGFTGLERFNWKKCHPLPNESDAFQIFSPDKTNPF
jgi:hypothetical protein